MVPDNDERPHPPAPRRTKPRELLSYEPPWEPGIGPSLHRPGCLKYVVGGSWRTITFRRVRRKVAASRARREAKRAARRAQRDDDSL